MSFFLKLYSPWQFKYVTTHTTRCFWKWNWLYYNHSLLILRKSSSVTLLPELRKTLILFKNKFLHCVRNCVQIIQEKLKSCAWNMKIKLQKNLTISHISTHAIAISQQWASTCIIYLFLYLVSICKKY